MQNDNITVRQLYDAKKKADDKISEALTEFKKSTGLNISSIGIMMVDSMVPCTPPHTVGASCVILI